MAEETGLIAPIGEWVLREACRQYVAWQDEGVLLPHLAVNVSARQFREKKFVAKSGRSCGRRASRRNVSSSRSTKDC